MPAYLCVAPEKGSPSPLAEVLTDDGSAGLEVKKLWDKPVDTPGLRLAVLYWHSWRDEIAWTGLNRAAYTEKPGPT